MNKHLVFLLIVALLSVLFISVEGTRRNNKVYHFVTPTTVVHPITNKLEGMELTIDNDVYQISQLKSMENHFSADYKEVIISSDSFHENIPAERMGSCFYSGKLSNFNAQHHSNFATFMNCDDELRGFIQVNGKERMLELREVNSHFSKKELSTVNHQGHSHVLLEAIIDKEQQGQSSCGVKTTIESHDIHVHNDDDIHIIGGRTLQATNECNGNPTKYVEIVVVNDQSHSERRPYGEAETFSAEAFAITAGIYAANGFACTISLHLVGQVSYRKMMPDDIIERSCNTVDDFLNNATTGSCCNDVETCTGAKPYCIADANGLDLTLPGCYAWTYTNAVSNIAGTSTRSDITVTARSTTSSSEIDETRLLDSITQWGFDKQGTTSLETLFGYSVDNIALFSGKDFVGGVRGLANLGAQCSSLSASIEQVTDDDTSYLGSLFAHELGHNFNMPHVADGTIMEVASSVSNPRTLFASSSISTLDAWMIEAYNVGSVTACLDNNPGTVDWTVSTCGDGRVDIGEECDPGFKNIYNDTCCDTTTCQLLPGCSCSNHDLCCDNGSFRPDTYICRSAIDATCDTDEYCTGASGSCPVDIYYADSGLACGISGVCYQGECKEDSDVCAGLAPTEAYCPIDFTFSSGAYECVVACAASNTPCPSSITTYNLQVDDGYYCADGCQCVGGTCYDSTSLISYAYVDNVCKSSDGTTVANTYCDTAPTYTACPPGGAGLLTCDSNSFTMSDYATYTGSGCATSGNIASGDTCEISCKYVTNTETLTCAGGFMVGIVPDCPNRVSLLMAWDNLPTGYHYVSNLTTDLPDILATNSPYGEAYQYEVGEVTTILTSYTTTSYTAVINVFDAIPANLTEFNTAVALAGELTVRSATDPLDSMFDALLVSYIREPNTGNSGIWYMGNVAGYKVWEFIVAVFGLLILCCCCGCLYLRRKRAGEHYASDLRMKTFSHQ